MWQVAAGSISAGDPSTADATAEHHHVHCDHQRLRGWIRLAACLGTSTGSPWQVPGELDRLQCGHWGLRTGGTLGRSAAAVEGGWHFGKHQGSVASAASY